MREDMFKVIVERPRVQGGETYRTVRRRTRQCDGDELPSFQGIRKPHTYFRKQLNENLSPLRAFFISRIGKPWDKVYSELNKNVNVQNAVQAHVRSHVFQLVERDVVIGTDRLVWSAEYGWRGNRLLKVGDLYIDNKGFLRQILKAQVPKVKFDKGMKLYVMLVRRYAAYDFVYREHYVAVEKAEYNYHDWSKYKIEYEFRAGTERDAHNRATRHNGETRV